MPSSLPPEFVTMRREHVEAGGAVYMDGSRSDTYCLRCNRGWPCDTIRALNQLESALTDLATAREALGEVRELSKQPLSQEHPWAALSNVVNIANTALAAIDKQRVATQEEGNSE